jgi:hypothetical protein
MKLMKVPQLISGLVLTLALLLYAGESPAFPSPGKDKAKQQQDDPTYKYYEASSLSGIDLQADKKTKAFILTFDQHLSGTGLLEIKNAAHKILFSRVLAPNTGPLTRHYEVGPLKPGIYSIEVKTTDTTFWKKVKISR